MKPILILLGFGLPAALALLAIGGDLSLSGTGELERITAEEWEPPPGPLDSGESHIRQKILDWEYRHFDPGLGVFDWFARGVEAVPRGKKDENRYEVVEPEILFSSFTKTTPLLKKTLTKLNAGRGHIQLGAKSVSGQLMGGVEVSSMDLFTPHGLTEVKLRTDELNVQAANRRQSGDEPAATFWTEKAVHVTGASFEVFGKGGMRGATELNRMTINAPITMHLVTQKQGLFFGKMSRLGRDERRVDVKGRGPLVVERLAQQNVFLMSMSGGVTVVDGEISVESEKLGVALGQSRAVEKAFAMGGIVVREKGEARLFGEEARWDALSGRTTVTGSRGVRFVDGGNTLEAGSATLLEDRKTLVLERGVKARLEGAIAGNKDTPGGESFPRDWRVSCERAEVLLADEGGSMKAARALLLPAEGEKVLVASADGAYEIKGGSVLWNAAGGTVEVRREPEVTRGQSEWVRSDSISLRLDEGVLVFEGRVVASFKAGGAAWKFHAGRMTAQFESREGERPRISNATLTDPEGRVRIDYTGRGNARVQLVSDRVSWNAKSQVAVLDTEVQGRSQRLEHGRDWVEAHRIVFEPDSKKALFEGAVRAHLEETAEEPGALPGGRKKIAEPPFEMSSEKLTVRFGEQYETKEALAEGKVRFAGSSGGIVLNCERALYVMGEAVTFEGKKRPELVSGKNRLSARRIEVYLARGRIVFHDKVAGGFDDGGGAAMVASCEKMIALYEKASGAVRDVYFQGGVHVEVKSEKTGETTADGDRAVYEVAKSLVSLVGEPVVVHQKGIVIREEKVVYDLKEKVLFTKPGKKGYNWEFEGSDWMNKPKGK